MTSSASLTVGFRLANETSCGCETENATSHDVTTVTGAEFFVGHHGMQVPMVIPIGPYMVPIYGFVSPPVILLTVVTNSLVCLVLVRRKSMRTPTNALLAALALSDTMTGLCPLPCFVYFHAAGGYRDWVPFNWCWAYPALTEHLPTVFHTASIWITVALAVHRYVCVCRPQQSKQWCTMRNVVRTVVGVYVTAFVVQFTRFVEMEYTPVDVTSIVNPTLTYVGCLVNYAQFVRFNIDLYYNLYYWCRVVLVHFVPCFSLIVLNGLLVRTLCIAQRRRVRLLSQNRKTECRRLAESNLTTMMLVAVVCLFLIVELPLAGLLIVLIVDNTFDLDLLDEQSRLVAPLVVNLFILFSYPLNFFVYCGMSRQFRESFRSLICTGTNAGGGGTTGPGADPTTVGAVGVLSTVTNGGRLVGLLPGGGGGEASRRLIETMGASGMTTGLVDGDCRHVGTIKSTTDAQSEC